MHCRLFCCAECSLIVQSTISFENLERWRLIQKCWLKKLTISLFKHTFSFLRSFLRVRHQFSLWWYRLNIKISGRELQIVWTTTDAHGVRRQTRTTIEANKTAPSLCCDKSLYAWVMLSDPDKFIQKGLRSPKRGGSCHLKLKERRSATISLFVITTYRCATKGDERHCVVFNSDYYSNPGRFSFNSKTIETN